MWDRVLQLLAVSCRHRHMSKPFSAGYQSRHDAGQGDWQSVSPARAGHYVVCLDCGKHFDYDWSRMRVMK